MKFFKYSCLILASFFIFSTAAMADRGRIYVSTDYLYDVCMDRCAQTDSLGNLTRNGCLKGCAEIRRTFPLKDKKYRSMSACLQDMKDFELERDLFIEESKKWCNREYTHLHKRKGCWDAMEVYINAATPNTICYGQKDNASLRFVGNPELIGLPISTLPPYIDIPLVHSEPIRDTPAYGERAKKAPRLKAPASQPVAKIVPLSTPPSSPASTKKSQTSKSPARNDGVPVLTPSSAMAGNQKTTKKPATISPAKADEKDLPAPAAPLFKSSKVSDSDSNQIRTAQDVATPDVVANSTTERSSSQSEKIADPQEDQTTQAFGPKNPKTEIPNSEIPNTEIPELSPQNQLQEAKSKPSEEPDIIVEIPKLPLFPKEGPLEDQPAPRSTQSKPGLLPTIPTGLGPERNLYQEQPINLLPDSTSSSGRN